MGRPMAIDRDDLAVWLKERGKPVPTSIVADQFNVCVPTARKTCKAAREQDGYPIWPTPEGQWYVDGISTVESLDLFVRMMDWSARGRAAYQKLNTQVHNAIEAVPQKRLEKLRDELESEKAVN